MRFTKQVPTVVELQKCDRCGTEQTRPETPRIIYLTASFTDAGFDLCVPCAKAVKDFIQAGVPTP